jgi:hypothetical protein
MNCKMNYTMMNTPDIKIDDGVLIQNNFLSREQCSWSIDFFEKMNLLNMAFPRDENHHQKDDTSVSLLEGDVVERHFKPLGDSFNPILNQVGIMFAEYRRKYSVLQDEKYQVFDIKIQKTEVGQGYHIWHDDYSPVDKRVTTFIVYLNDVKEGGETEFLYKPKRIQAEAGKLLMFPANYMWAHRGNTPISNTKYILTGWIEHV